METTKTSRFSKSPNAAQIRQARSDARLTQAAAAELVHTDTRRWQTWEAGTARMHPGMFELFTIKTSMLAAIKSVMADMTSGKPMDREGNLIYSQDPNLI